MAETIGDRIRRLRRRQRITQEQLAARLQVRGHSTVTRQRIQDIEHGRRVVQPDELVSLARVLGVAISEILGVSDRE